MQKRVFPITFLLINLLITEPFYGQNGINDSLNNLRRDRIIQKNDTTRQQRKTNLKSWWENLPLDLSTEIIGGALYFFLGSGITIAFAIIRRKIYKRKFRQVFGDDIKAFSIVYPPLSLQAVYDQYGQLVQFPYTKGNGTFRMSEPVSQADLKAGTYIAEVFYKVTSKNPHLITDQAVRNQLDFSFCSVGGLSNFKTNDILQDAANSFYRFNTVNVVNITRISDNLSFNNSNTHDLGIIVKIRNSNFPNRTQICIAGLGESGTSGAAWYLARHWRKLRKTVKDNDFGAIIKVRNGVDESATLIELLKK